jgi:H/ACA ribonucleoprotein complex subunit 3
MAKHILKCPQCGVYTMKQVCSTCGVKTLNVSPPKYSPDDRMGKYRRIAKKEMVKNGN